jgi:type IV pilus assembly protein PilA
MIVVAIVGVLAVLAIYGVRKYIANSKTTEARNSLGQIGKDAASAFEKERGNSGVVTIGGTSGLLRSLCPSTSKVPAAAPQAAKYQSQPSDWGANNGDTGWACLKFSLEQPQYYSYQYVAGNTTSSAGAYSATAEGDLNGDGNTSLFTVNGSVQSGALATSPTIGEVNPEE